jgi:transcription elongation factor GreB
MSRWRPPPLKSSPYITAEGALALSTELSELWKLRRNEVVPALSAAAAEGDRSENAEYIYRKKQLGEIDRRIRYISKRLDEIEVIDRVPEQTDKVFFGATVTVVDEDGEQFRYRIVGADETNSAMGYISVDSPVARALLGQRTGVSVSIEIPDKTVTYVVVDISYEHQVK